MFCGNRSAKQKRKKGRKKMKEEMAEFPGEYPELGSSFEKELRAPSDPWMDTFIEEREVPENNKNTYMRFLVVVFVASLLTYFVVGRISAEEQQGSLTDEEMLLQAPLEESSLGEEEDYLPNPPPCVHGDWEVTCSREQQESDVEFQRSPFRVPDTFRTWGA